MQFIHFQDVKFTIIIDGNGEPWWIAREIFDYLERGRDTLIRHVGKPNRKMAIIFCDGQRDDMI